MRFLQLDVFCDLGKERAQAVDKGLELLGSQLSHKASASDQSRLQAMVHELEHSLAQVAAGESVIKFPSPLNVLKDTYNHRCY
jgi:hypothetical protein